MCVGNMLTKRFNILIILLSAFLLRIYRLPELLGFWYDQGRDALVIWDLINKGKLFLIGPMMGFTGMFRGPWYYYLIAPFYYLGKGNPIFPLVFLISITVFAIYVLYDVGNKLGGKSVGLLAAFLAGFSSYIINSSRWLSNPTPMLLIGIALVWVFFRYLEKKVWSLPLATFLIGMGLNFGAATEIYYIPALILILFINRKILPSLKILILSLMTFLFTFLPQMIFEIRHPGVLSGALYNFIFQENSFTYNFVQILILRLKTYYDIFASKFFVNGNLLFLPFFVLFIFNIFRNFKKYWKEDRFKIVFILFLAPFLGTLFFVSNLGGFYDYYFTGYYLIFILFFSFIFINLTKLKFGKFILIIFMSIFLFKNYQSFKFNYGKSLNDGEIIAFKNQLSVINWIKSDSKNNPFNVDVYVPPVIPYAYEYLFLWQNLGQQEKLTTVLYTLYEIDPPHPERLEAWLDRQDGIGKVTESVKFGGITVDKRERITHE